MWSSFKELIHRSDARALDIAMQNPRRVATEKRCGNLIDVHGQTLLMYAIRAKSSDCAHVILKHMQDARLVNYKETANRGSTALHLAVQNNDFTLVAALVKAGGDVTIQDAMSHTPLSLAGGPGRRKIRMFLSGLWKKRKWSAFIHPGTPPSFQREAMALAKVNWKLRAMSKDVMGKVLETLLELHRREFAGRDPRYLSPVVDKRCIGITTKGTRCKLNAKKFGRCRQHS